MCNWIQIVHFLKKLFIFFTAFLILDSNCNFLHFEFRILIYQYPNFSIQQFQASYEHLLLIGN